MIAEAPAPSPVALPDDREPPRQHPLRGVTRAVLLVCAILLLGVVLGIAVVQRSATGSIPRHTSFTISLQPGPLGCALQLSSRRAGVVSLSSARGMAFPAWAAAARSRAQRGSRRGRDALRARPRLYHHYRFPWMRTARNFRPPFTEGKIFRQSRKRVQPVRPTCSRRIFVAYIGSSGPGSAVSPGLCRPRPPARASAIPGC